MSLPRIILVEPQGPLNVGSVARVMKNFGLRHLVLVNPRCSINSRDALQMASHAQDILESAQQAKSLDEALKGCSLVVAATARERKALTPLESPQQIFPQLSKTTEQTALMFGPEDRGLNNEELDWAQKWLCIPASSEYPILNLAQAVAICCHELFQCEHALNTTMIRPLSEEPLRSESPADLTEINQYLEHLSTLLFRIGYLHPKTINDRMGKIRRLFYRANLTSQETAMLRGMVSQMEWALANPDKLEDDTH